MDRLEHLPEYIVRVFFYLFIIFRKMKNKPGNFVRFTPLYILCILFYSKIHISSKANKTSSYPS